MDIELVAREVVDSAMKVHTVLGPGLLESACKACLSYELQKRGLRVRSEVELPIIYDSGKVSAGYGIDLIVDECVIVELKAGTRVADVHDGQLLSSS